MKYLFNLIPVIVFSALALVITIPLLSPGYIFTVDQVIGTKLSLPSLASFSFLYSTFLYLVNIVLPSYVIQKIILFFIFFLSGFGMYKLLSEKTGIVGYFAGIFYAVNPFVYERIMAGQWYLLLAYAFFPLAVIAAIKAFHRPSLRYTLLLAFFASLFINLAGQYVFIYFIFILIYGLGTIYNKREVASYIVKQAPFFILVLFLLNINWIISTVLQYSQGILNFNQYDANDLISFQSVADSNLGLIFNLLSGYGFWAEVYDYFILPKNIIFFWPIVAICFIGLSLYGLVKIIVNREKHDIILAVTLIIMFFLALDFAAGIALESFAPVVFSLYEKIPLLWAFREPQKLVGIMMFSYAYFGSFGLSYLLAKVKERSKILVISFLFFVLPFAYTPLVIGGFWGQLKPVFYPNSWYEVNKILKNDKDTFLTVFFPWHQYTRFRFANNRVVANPAPYFFDKPVISSQNYETMSLNTHDTRTESLHVEGLLSIEKEGVNLLGDEVTEKFPWGESLSPINVKYIILAKDDDWRNYRFLNTQTDLAKVSENDDLVLYQNLKWGVESENTEATETTDR